MASGRRSREGVFRSAIRGSSGGLAVLSFHRRPPEDHDKCKFDADANIFFSIFTDGIWLASGIGVRIILTQIFLFLLIGMGCFGLMVATAVIFRRLVVTAVARDARPAFTSLRSQ